MSHAKQAPAEMPEQYAMCLIKLSGKVIEAYFDPTEGGRCWKEGVNHDRIASSEVSLKWCEKNDVEKIIFGE